MKKPALEKAQRALADAQANPNERLAQAGALADLADAVTAATGYPAAELANLGSGVQLIQRARAIWSDAAPDPALAAQLQTRGRQFALMRRCPLAQPVLQIALDMAEKTKGPEDPQTLESVNDLLRLSLALDDRATVAALAPRLLESLDKDGAPGIDRHSLYQDLGDFYYEAQDYGKAESLVRRSQELARAQSPQDPAAIRRHTYALASIYYAQLRFAEAEGLIAPLAPPASTLPVPEAERRRTREQMAAVVRAGDLKGALAFGERTLGQYEAELAQGQTLLAQAEAGYADAPKYGPQREKAAKELAAARSRAHGDQTNVARMQSYIGELHHAMNQLTQAEAMYMQALAQYAKSRFPSEEIIRVKTDLAMLYRSRGEPERALPLQEDALNAMLPSLGPDHPDVLETQDELALIYKALKRYKEAEPLYVERLERAERRKAGMQEVAGDLEALSEIAVGQGNPAGAAAYMERMLALWEQGGAAHSAQWSAALGRLAKLYRDSGQAGKARTLEKRLAVSKKKK